MALTELEIKNAKPRGKPYSLSDGDGLLLLVKASGAKSWALRYHTNGKEKRAGLGKYPKVSLANARGLKTAFKRELALGRSPQKRRKTVGVKALGSATFGTVADEWYETHEKAWSDSNRAGVRHRLDAYLLPKFGERPIREITLPELLGLLLDIEKSAPSTAHRTKSLADRIFQFAIMRGDSDYNIVLSLKKSLKPVRERHFAALTTPRDVADLMARIEAYHGSAIVRAALWFSLYTFQRPGEIRGAAWEEMDFGVKLWRIAGHRMKNKRPHLVPLSCQALELLESLKRLAARTEHSPFVFPSKVSKTAPINALTICAAIRTMGYTTEQMTAHGFRALASTNLNEQGWDSDVIELSLSHVEGNAIRAAYNHAERLTERREMMQAWADWLDGLRQNGQKCSL
ncbi:MAG: tyrosine-type recombinase/integrase [Synergistaceae bacterium]|jgi:integrase|nr:tyrosine-type recombinase/integrase [Synergistaceae bacterium]